MPPLPRAPRIDAATVKAAVSLADVARGYGVVLSRAGREWVGLSPLKGERTPSFYVDEAKGLWKCFASGEGGDVIRLVELVEGCSFADALAKLSGTAGLEDAAEAKARAERYRRERAEAEARDAAAKQRRVESAAGIWRRTLPGEGSAVEAYLRHRGIDLDALRAVYGWRVPPGLRHAPLLRVRDGERWHEGPAMVGGVHDLGGLLLGIHRTMLAPGGLGKASIGAAKRTMGHIQGGASWLSAPGARAVIGEGYETTLSVMAALARRGEAVFGVSAISLGNMAGAALRRPHDPPRTLSPVPDPARPGLMLPDGVREVLLLRDADGKNPADIDIFIRRAATKFSRAGLVVRVATPENGSDFNDLVTE